MPGPVSFWPSWLPSHLHSCVKELPHVGEAAAGQLGAGHPLEGLLNDLIINEDEFLSLAEALGDKSCEPMWEQREMWTEEGISGQNVMPSSVSLFR